MLDFTEQLSWLPAGLVGLAVAWAAIIRLRRYQKWRRSAGWPMARATYRYADIVPRSAGHMGASTVYDLLVGFNYFLDGTEHFGEFKKEFPSRGEAEQLRNSLEVGPLLVRVNPLSASDYVLDPYRDVRDSNISDKPDVPPVGPSVGTFNDSRTKIMDWPRIQHEIDLSHILSVNSILFVGILFESFTSSWFYLFLALANAYCCVIGLRYRWRRAPVLIWHGRLLTLILSFAWVVGYIRSNR